jgi:hypothetical protein
MVSPTLARGSAAGIAESVDLSMCGGNFPFELIDFGFEIGDFVFVATWAAPRRLQNAALAGSFISPSNGPAQRRQTPGR